MRPYLKKINKILGAGEMAQSEEMLAAKPNDLFDPWKPHGLRKEPTLISCPLTSMRAPRHMPTLP